MPIGGDSGWANTPSGFPLLGLRGGRKKESGGATPRTPRKGTWVPFTLQQGAQVAPSRGNPWDRPNPAQTAGAKRAIIGRIRHARLHRHNEE